MIWSLIDSYEIQTNQDILIGRDQGSWYSNCVRLSYRANRISDIHLQAPWISNRHMRIYSVVYDEETKEVEPFVYAQDLSSNGYNTWLLKKAHCWEPYVLSKGLAVLLSHGDGLRLCDGTRFEYNSNVLCYASSPELDAIRELEKNVHLYALILLPCWHPLVSRQLLRYHWTQARCGRLRYGIHGSGS